MIRHILTCFAISWLSAASLGIIYGASIVRIYSIQTLWSMAIIQVSLIISTCIAFLATPLVMLALKEGGYRLLQPVALWLLLAIYCLLVTPRSSALGLIGMLFIAAVGLTLIAMWGRR